MIAALLLITLTDDDFAKPNLRAAVWHEFPGFIIRFVALLPAGGWSFLIVDA